MEVLIDDDIFQVSRGHFTGSLYTFGFIWKGLRENVRRIVGHFPMMMMIMSATQLTGPSSTPRSRGIDITNGALWTNRDIKLNRWKICSQSSRSIGSYEQSPRPSALRLGRHVWPIISDGCLRIVAVVFHMERWVASHAGGTTKNRMRWLDYRYA